MYRENPKNTEWEKSAQRRKRHDSVSRPPWGVRAWITTGEGWEDEPCPHDARVVLVLVRAMVAARSASVRYEEEEAKYAPWISRVLGTH